MDGKQEMEQLFPPELIQVLHTAQARAVTWLAVSEEKAGRSAAPTCEINRFLKEIVLRDGLNSVADPDLHGSVLIWLSWMRICTGMRIQIQEQKIDQKLQKTWFPAFQKGFWAYWGTCVLWHVTYTKYIYIFIWDFPFKTMKSGGGTGKGWSSK